MSLLAGHTQLGMVCLERPAVCDSYKLPSSSVLGQLASPQGASRRSLEEGGQLRAEGKLSSVFWALPSHQPPSVLLSLSTTRNTNDVILEGNLGNTKE